MERKIAFQIQKYYHEIFYTEVFFWKKVEKIYFYSCYIIHW